MAFFATSILSMGGFAAVFGVLTHSIMLTGGAGGGGGGGDRGGDGDGGGNGDSSGGGDGDSGGDGGGRATDRPTHVAMGLNLGAGCSAIVVGVLWLVLSSLEILDL